MEHVLSFSGVFLIVILALVIYKYGKHIHKNEYRYYGIMAFLAVIGTVFAVLHQLEVVNVEIPFIYELFFQGHLTLAFFVIVMYGGAFKNKSKPKITIMKVRREMAILGFLTLIPHAVLLIITALNANNPTGVIAFTILLPLAVTSWPRLRKKMHAYEWRGFHKWAYLAYASIFAHLAAINILAQDDAFRYVRLAIYVVIFGLYTFLKFKNHVLVENPAPKSKKQTKKA